MLTLESSAAEEEFQLYLITTAINYLNMWFQPIASWLVICIANHVVVSNVHNGLE